MTKKQLYIYLENCRQKDAGMEFRIVMRTLCAMGHIEKRVSDRLIEWTWVKFKESPYYEEDYTTVLGLLIDDPIPNSGQIVSIPQDKF